LVEEANIAPPKIPEGHALVPNRFQNDCADSVMPKTDKIKIPGSAQPVLHERTRQRNDSAIFGALILAILLSKNRRKRGEKKDKDKRKEKYFDKGIIKVSALVLYPIFQHHTHSQLYWRHPLFINLPFRIIPIIFNFYAKNTIFLSIYYFILIKMHYINFHWWGSLYFAVQVLCNFMTLWSFFFVIQFGTWRFLGPTCLQKNYKIHAKKSYRT